MDTTSIRLSEALARALDRVAEDRHTTRSEVIREAIEQYCERHAAGDSSDRVAMLTRLVDYEGSGRGDLAERSEEVLRRMFDERRRRRSG